MGRVWESGKCFINSVLLTRERQRRIIRTKSGKRGVWRVGAEEMKVIMSGRMRDFSTVNLNYLRAFDFPGELLLLGCGDIMWFFMFYIAKYDSIMFP